MTVPMHGYPDWQNPLATTEQLTVVETSVVAPAGSISTGVIDMRPYSSCDIVTQATVVGAPTAFGTVLVTVQWSIFDDETDICWRDGHTTHPFSNGGGAFDVLPLTVYAQDNVRGPYLVVRTFNLGPDSVNANIIVYGSSRTLSGPSVRQDRSTGVAAVGSVSPLLISETTAVAIGATRTTPLAMAPGLAHISVTATAAPATVTLTGASGRLVLSVAGIAAIREQIILPDESTILRVANAGGVIMTQTAIIGTLRNLR